MWNDLTIFVVQKLNSVTSWISPPPVSHAPRRVLVVQCHPNKRSFNSQAADSVCKGLLKAGHSVRLRTLYAHDGSSPAPIGSGHLDVGSYGSISPALSAVHLEHHYDAESTDLDVTTVVPPDVQGAVADLLWCDSLVLVYPTWWFNFPAAMKGYFDRVFLPGVAFKVPKPGQPAPLVGGTGLIPQLQHIDKVGVVTSFGASRLVVAFAGDNGRRFVSRGLRALCAPGCQMSWHGLYEATVSSDAQRAAFLQQLEQDYQHF